MSDSRGDRPVSVIEAATDGEVPEPGKTMLELDDFLPYRLSVLSNTVSEAIAGAYSQRFGLSIPEWRVLAVLGQMSDISAKQVTERTAMDKVRVSRAVALLVQKGHIECRTHPRDRRYSILRHSAAGRTIYERIVPLARAYERKLLDILTVGERKTLDRLLAKLKIAADDL